MTIPKNLERISKIAVIVLLGISIANLFIAIKGVLDYPTWINGITILVAIATIVLYVAILNLEYEYCSSKQWINKIIKLTERPKPELFYLVLFILVIILNILKKDNVDVCTLIALLTVLLNVNKTKEEKKVEELSPPPS